MVNFKTVCFKTLGCKVNQYETQAIREQVESLGLVEAKDRADIFIVNTCTVTQKSDCESKEIIRNILKKNPNAFVLVTGCYAEKNSDELSRIENIGAIVPNSKKANIASILRGSEVENKDILTFSISDFKGHTKAFIKVQDGCNRFCTFCKIPLVRGRSRSRPLKDVVDEVKRLVENGFKEVVLTGICLGDYGKDFKDGTDLVKLIDNLEEIDFDFRIRLSSIDPEDITEELITRFASSKKLCRHLHIPLQCGDDKILKRMNRHYSSSEFIGLVNKINSAVEGVAITLDVMVGFPGESEAHFKNTLSLIEAISPLRIHIFPYSRREDTKAANYDGVVAQKIISERIKRLRELQAQISYNFRRRFISKDLQVLVETKRDKTTGLLAGYSDNYIKILFEGSDDLMHNLIRVKVLNVTHNCTFGRQNGN